MGPPSLAGWTSRAGYDGRHGCPPGCPDHRDRALDPTHRWPAEGDRPGAVRRRLRRARPASCPARAGDAGARADRADRRDGGAGGPRRRGCPDRRRPADRHRRERPRPRAARPERDPVGRPAGRAGRGRDRRGRRRRGAARPGRHVTTRGGGRPRMRVRARRGASPPHATRGGGRHRQRGVAACRGRRRDRAVHARRARLGQRRGTQRLSAGRYRGGAGGLRRRGRGTLHHELGPPGLSRAAGRDGRARRRRRPPRHQRDAGHLPHALGACPPVRPADGGSPGDRGDARWRIRWQVPDRRTARRCRGPRPGPAGPRRADPERGLPDGQPRTRDGPRGPGGGDAATAGCAACRHVSCATPVPSPNRASRGSPRS